MPSDALVAPGPRVTKQMPGRAGELAVRFRHVRGAAFLAADDELESVLARRAARRARRDRLARHAERHVGAVDQQRSRRASARPLRASVVSAGFIGPPEALRRKGLKRSHDSRHRWIQILMDRLHHDRALADARGDALDRAGAHVADREDAGARGGERRGERAVRARPARCGRSRLASSARQPSSQSVFGSAPIITKTLPMRARRRLARSRGSSRSTSRRLLVAVAARVISRAVCSVMRGDASMRWTR